MQDNKKISGIFPGEVISGDNGKIVSIEHELNGWRKEYFNNGICVCYHAADERSLHS
jgi:hypothetical protein